jgi:hypothetical protein
VDDPLPASPNPEAPAGDAQPLDFLEHPTYPFNMKCTQYFRHVRERPDRSWILQEWIQRVVREPDFEQVQNDGRIRRWKRIAEAEGRFLRVVLLNDGKTVHNAFFDRRRQE